MAVSVGDLLALDVLKEAHVAVGAEGLSRTVRYIDVVEVPDIAEWSKAETVYMTTAYPFAGREEDFERTVRGFIAHGVSALFLKLGRFIETIPERVLQIAAENHFPIIILPTETVYSPIITAVAQQIYEAQADNGSRLQQKLNELILQGEGISGLAELLAGWLDGEVYVEDQNAQLVYSAGGNSFIKQYQARLWAEESLESYKDLWHYHDYYHTVMLMNLYLGDALEGNVVCILRGMVKVSEFYYDAIKRSAIVMALALSREAAVFETKLHLEQEMLEGIVSGLSPEETAEQMLKADWDPGARQIFAVMITERRDEFMPRQVFEQIQHKITYKLSQGLAESAIRGVFIRRKDDFVCLFSFAEEGAAETISRVKERLRQFILMVERDFGDVVLTVGLSRTVMGTERLAAGLAEARRTARIGKKTYGSGRLYEYDEMGVYKLLFTHGDREMLAEFYADYLLPLVQYDQKHHSDLVGTLEMYYANNANVLATAEQMYIHRNTLNYRLKRISQILGRDIDDVEHKICISLAIRIRRLLNPE